MATKRASEHFQIACAGRVMDVSVCADQLTCNGRTVPFSYERLGKERMALLIDGKSYVAVVLEESGDRRRIGVGGSTFDVSLKDERALLLERFGLSGGAESATLKVHAPMPGMVLSVTVEPGQLVEAGSGALVLEAMKMENELRVERGGTVRAVHVAPGDAVGKNDLLLEIE